MLASDGFKSRVYGTFQQIRSNGGAVRKGEKSSLVVFWKRLSVIDEASQQQKTRYMLRYYHVFNTDQADFDEIGREKVAKMNLDIVNGNKPHVSAEMIISGYRDRPVIRYSSKDGQACYYPSLDMVSIPEMKFFTSSESFYRVIFHELGHSTGHKSRLNRQDSFGNTFGSDMYSREELVAELCSSFLSDVAGLDDGFQNSVAYIRGWASHLRENHNWILWASSRAEKAADYILGNQHEDLQEIEADTEASMVEDVHLDYMDDWGDNDDTDYEDDNNYLPQWELETDCMGRPFSDADPGL